MRRLPALLFRTLVSVVLLSQVCSVRADGDHDEAKRLVESGDILPLQVILEKLQPHYPGKILKVELEKKSDQIFYELEIVGHDGVVHELYIDASTGDVLHSKVED